MGMLDFFTQQKSDVGPLPSGQSGGFFGTSWEDPRTQRNMALFAGLLGGGGNRGLAGALGDGMQNMQAANNSYNELQMLREKTQAAKEQLEWERKRQEKADNKLDPKEVERREIGRLLMNAPTGVGSHHAMAGMDAIDESPAPMPYADVQQARGDTLASGGYSTEGLKYYEEARKAREEARKAREEARKAREQPTNNDTALMKTMRAQGIAPGSKEWIDTLNAERLSTSGQGFRIPGAQNAAMERALATAGIAAKNKAPTEFEQKITLYSKSMKEASKDLNEMEESGTRPGVAASLTPGWMPGRGYLQSANEQKLERAGKQWIDSINRIRSGAAMPEVEYERALSVFMPKLGDDEATIKSKRKAREAEESFLSNIENRVSTREDSLKNPNQAPPPRMGTDISNDDFMKLYGGAP